MTEQDVCQLCASGSDVAAYPVAPRSSDISLCGRCHAQTSGGELDADHLRCLQESAWSQEPPVQVVAYRLLQRLSSVPWATDLLSQLYLEDDVLAWAKELGEEQGAAVRDSNGAALADGDAVTLIKDLDVKGAGFTAKRGTLVKNIRLGADPTHVEGRVNKTAIFLKTAFLKKAN